MKKIILIIIVSLLSLATIAFTFIPGFDKMLMVIYINSITTTEFTVEDDLLYMNGYINSKTFNQLVRVVEDNPQLETIVMLDVPGSADDEVNLPMATWVRNKGFNTPLTSSSHVASGGSDFFLAGVERTLEEGAKIGVHSWGYGNGDGADLDKSDPAHEMNRKYIQDMLGKDDFYWYTLEAASADDMHYMSLDEIKYYNLYTRFIAKEKL
jgi:hypothetical protein